MVDEFRAAFQELIDASVATDPHQFPPAVHKVYLLASHIPATERELALEALTPLLAGEHAAPGVIADLAVVAGALVEMGTDPGPAGPQTLHLLRTMGTGAIAFLRAWEHTGTDTPPDPDTVTADAEARVARQLGNDAPAATMCWWTIRRHGLATKTMLSQPQVRAHVRSDPTLHAQLVAITNQLSHHLTEFDELRTLLRMSKTTSALVMDRTSARAFRVLFDGIGDNFQLHTLLADALIGPHRQDLPGQAPDPRWVDAYRNAPADPDAPAVHSWWNLLAHDGSRVWNEGLPAEIPTIDGEHVLILDQQPYPRTWTARRRHPQVSGWLEVDSELPEQEALLWWKRVTPTTLPTPGQPPVPEPAEPATDTEPGPGSHEPPPAPVEPVPQSHAEPQEAAPQDSGDTNEADPHANDHDVDAGAGADDSHQEPGSDPHEPEQGAGEHQEAGERPQTGEHHTHEPEQPEPTDARPQQPPAPPPPARPLPPLPPGVSRSKGWGPTWR